MSKRPTSLGLQKRHNAAAVTRTSHVTCNRVQKKAGTKKQHHQKYHKLINEVLRVLTSFNKIPPNNGRNFARAFSLLPCTVDFFQESPVIKIIGCIAGLQV